MGIASNIISVIIKSVVNSKLGDGLGSELIGIPIDEYSNIGVDKLKEFIDGEKLKIEHILSEENMKAMDVAEENIDFVVAELKDLLSKVEITDRVFRECKYSNENLKDFLWNEYRRDKDIIENGSEIKKGLYVVAKTLIELMRESEKFEQDFLIQISNAVDDANVELQKISDYMHNNYGGMNEEIQMILVIVQMILEQIQNFGIEKQNTQRKIQSRTQEYADKWNANMFLNNFDEWDENAGENVKLQDVYIDDHLPHFIWGDNKNESTNLNDLLSQYIENMGKNKMLLILGQPGIGKSTLVTWITARFADKIDNILVYQFANDLNNINWSKSKVFDEILDTLVLSFSDLEDKTLIFDGFDEINVGENRRVVLDKIYNELIYGKNIKNLSLIITCRENYIEGFERLKCKYITLQPWDEIQIRSFCNIFHEKTKNEVSECTIKKVIEKKDVFGIPLILYMVLALNISIEKDGSIVDVYDKIFSLEGGIYDRCIDNKEFAGSHRMGEVKEQVHQISRDIAVWMFENNPNEASIPQKEYQKICTNVMKEVKQENEDIKQDFLIGNFFKKVRHCEGIENKMLYFVHRSIYEYFVAETIYNSIKNAMEKLSDDSQMEFAGNIAIYLKEGEITYVIGEFLKRKIIKLYSKLEHEKKEKFYDWLEMSICKMVDAGMFFYTKKNIQNYRRITVKETQCFENLVKILRLLLGISKRKYIMEKCDINQCERYIRYSCIEQYIIMKSREGATVLNLSNMFLEKINLAHMDLFGAILKNANLREADLRNACLVTTDLRNTDLGGVNFCYADIEDANLRGADLRGAIFDEKQIVYLKKKYNLCGTRVYIEKTNEIISYERYCSENNLD